MQTLGLVKSSCTQVEPEFVNLHFQTVSHKVVVALFQTQMELWSPHITELSRRKNGFQRIIQNLQILVFIYLLILLLILDFRKSIIIMAHIYDFKMQQTQIFSLASLKLRYYHLPNERCALIYEDPVFYGFKA